MVKFFREDWSPRNRGRGLIPSEVSFYAASDEPTEMYPFDPVGRHPAADVSIRLSKEIPLYDMHSNSSTGEEVVSPERQVSRKMAALGHGNEAITAAVEAQRNTPQMFFHVPAHIDSAFSHPSMRATVPTLLGMALNAAGKGAMASSSLSKHSSPIVQRALDAGLLKPNPRNPEGDITNDFDFDDRMLAIPTGGMPAGGKMPIDPVEVLAGRNVARKVIKRGNEKLSPQFAALQRLDQAHAARMGGNEPGSENDPNAMKLPGLD